VASPLRRLNLSVHRVQDAADASRMAKETFHDLLVVVLPLAGADALVRDMRAEGSASRTSGLVVVTEDDEVSENHTVARFANRRLPATFSELELREAATALLEVAQRVDVPPETRARLTLSSGAQRSLRIENLSTSGILMRASGPLPVGTVFGFAIDLPNDDEPIRGRAEVVRVSSPDRSGEHGIAARFRALGGDAPQRLARRIGSSAPATDPADTLTATGELDRTGARANATVEAAAQAPREPTPGEIERAREELVELAPLLDEMLERGLTRRLVVADWYVTGAELGLESLRAFSSILSSIYENRAISREAERRMADLVEVRRQLTEFGQPQQEVAVRVRILLELRPALERLLRELAETGAAAGTGLAASRMPGVVSQVVVEVQRLVASRRGLTTLLSLLDDLLRPRFLFGRGAARRSAAQILAEYGPLAASCGAPLSREGLSGRRRLRSTITAVDRQAREMRRRLESIHRKAFSLRLRRFATDDIESDLQDSRFHHVLVETLAAGAEYLARAYGAYRHALEAIGADPALIDRVERLGATLAMPEKAGERRVAGPPPAQLSSSSS
jgi:hypothetical protein